MSELIGTVTDVHGNKALVEFTPSGDPFAEEGCEGNACRTPEERPIEHVATMPNGVWIFRQANGAGGHTYYSDAIDGGTMLWDTCLVSEEELRFVMALEEQRRKIEKEIATNPEIQERIRNRERLLNDPQALDALIETIRRE